MADYSYSRYREIKFRRETTLRLFQQLHQNDDPVFRRAAGCSICDVCGLTYREHLEDTENEYFSDEGDRRLCDGDIVHL